MNMYEARIQERPTKTTKELRPNAPAVLKLNFSAEDGKLSKNELSSILAGFRDKEMLSADVYSSITTDFNAMLIKARKKKIPAELTIAISIPPSQIVKILE